MAEVPTPGQSPQQFLNTREGAGLLFDANPEAYMRLFAPKASYQDRTLPLQGGKLQKQTSHDGGRTWANIGQHYDRWNPKAGGPSLA